MAALLGGCGGSGDAESPPAARIVPVVEEIDIGATYLEEQVTQFGPPLTPLPVAGVAVVWNVDRDPRYQVAMQWLSDEGLTLWPPGGLTVAGPEVNGVFPIVVSDPGSGVFVAYDDPERGIVVHSFDEEGRARWPAEGVGATAGARSRPQQSLAADGSGGVFVCFEEQVATVRCQHLDASGRRSWGPLGADLTEAPGYRHSPRALSDGTGGVLVFWRATDDRSIRLDTSYRFEGQRLSSGGRRLWGLGLVSPQTTSSSFAVASDRRGGAVLVSGTPAPDGHSDLLAQRVSPDGVPLWGDGIRLSVGSSSGDATLYAESIVVTEGGGAFALGRTGNDVNVFRIAPNGDHLWPPGGVRPYDQTVGRNYGAFAALDGQTLWVIWTRQTGIGTGQFEANLARLDAAGRPLDGLGARVSTTGNRQAARGIAVGPSGQPFVLWESGVGTTSLSGGFVRLVER